MSGICGMIGAHAIAPEAEANLAAMMEALVARGPDGAAAHRDGKLKVAMGIRQLRATPDEPAAAVLGRETGEGTYLLCGDGRVFNYKEVAAWLSSRGRALRTSDPLEVFLGLYEEEGIAGFRRVDGQFALAIWDPRKAQLLLVRDFLGVRSLYYQASPTGVIFASEAKALLRHSAIKAEVDTAGVSHYLTFLTVPGPRTLLRGVRKAAPGTVTICRQDGTVSAERYWDLLWEPIPERDEETFYVDSVRRLHTESVQGRIVPGPMAALLSGGNDSSANVARMIRLGVSPLHTFTVGLQDVEGQSSYNDLYYARQVAERCGAQHHEALMPIDQFLELIPRTVEILDDLVSEPSCVFLYQALRMAQEQGLKVVMTGEANDELSCGHGEMIRIRQRYYDRWLKYMKLPVAVRRLAALAAPLLSPKRQDILTRAARGDEYFWNFETAWMDSEKPTILSMDAWSQVRDEGSGAVVRRYAEDVRKSAHGKRDYLDYIIYVMMQDHYFGNLMLGKLDLLAGSLGLEARCPYTAPAYAHFVYNIPAKFKFQGNQVKTFFKKALASDRLLGDDIIYRPKQGFRTPVVELFAGALGNWARPILLDSGLTREGVLRYDHLLYLLNSHQGGQADYSNRLWTAMVLNLWHEQWIRKDHHAAARQPAPATGALRAA